MGYYVQAVSSTAFIPKANLQRAYEKMCALNVTHDHEKNGGSWSAGGKQDGKWFSWMDANYPETCKDAQAVLEQLGFECEYNEFGDLCFGDYDSKTGQEDLFMKAIENEATGMITWRGEEGEVWVTKFHGGVVVDANSAYKLLGA